MIEQILTILLYAPLPISILWLLIGAAFSQANQNPSEPSAPSGQHIKAPPKL